MYRKLKYILVVSVLSINLYACGSGELVLSESQANGTSTTETVATDTNTAEGMNSMQVINPIKQVTAEESQEQMQISLVGVPENASDVTYTTIETGDIKVAQIKFTLDGSHVFVRSQKTDSVEIQDISGLYYEWTEVLESQVGECEAIVYIKDDVGYIAWLNLETGIVYNLGMTEGADKDALINLANEIFK